MQENETAATAPAQETATETGTTDAAAEQTENQTESAIAGNGASTATEAAPAEPEEQEEITYHAVQKDGNVTALWEMQGRKHLRTIDPRSREGQEILRLFTADEETQ